MQHASPTRTSDPKQAMKDSVPLGDAPPGGEQVGDGLGVVGVGLESEVRLERVDGLPGCGRAGGRSCRGALLLGIVGGDRGKPALDVQRGREIVRSQIDRLEVAEHARHDRPHRAGCELASESSTGRRVTSETCPSQPCRSSNSPEWNGSMNSGWWESRAAT